ncbi:hypothetical protein [Aneurinibacillus tyrosinisolvens]|uniref:hypothetical protein n=1 Tax=Aneurinibacillus tyrosinisolvens TaxID=1443435 RepID=UPI00128C78E0|nr:hypothetical protein [Aneurinibacillus tyrosinisolvens]
MSIKGTEKEFLFSLFLKTRPNILENTLNVKLEAGDILLEKSHQGMKLDMYSIDKHTGSEIYVENLLLKSNEPHQKKVLQIVDSIQKGIVVYQALGFHRNHVKQLKNKIEDSRKDIILYLVKINPKVIEALDSLNKLHKLEVFRNLNLLDNVQNPIHVVAKYGNMPDKNAERTPPIRKQDSNFGTREDINHMLLSELRRNIPYFLSFQREKSNIETNRLLQFGGGLSGTTYFVTLESRRKLAFLELRFTNESEYLYPIFKEKEHQIRERIGESVVFDDNRNVIGVYFKPSKDIQDTINQIVEVFRKMIHFFSDYFFRMQRFESNLAVS